MSLDETTNCSIKKILLKVVNFDYYADIFYPLPRWKVLNSKKHKKKVASNTLKMLVFMCQGRSCPRRIRFTNKLQYIKSKTSQLLVSKKNSTDSYFSYILVLYA